MDEFFENVSNKDDQQDEAVVIKFMANGQTKQKVRIEADRREDRLWKIKKRLLKKLKYKNYKSA